MKAAFILAYLVSPLAAAIYFSLWSPADLASWTSSLVPHQFTLSNYVTVWSEQPFLDYAVNAATIAFLATALSISFAYAFGLGLFFARRTTRLILVGVITLAIIIPDQITMVPVFSIGRWIGGINTHWYLAMVIASTTFTSVFISFHLQKFPESLTTQAVVDGMNWITFVCRVLTPYMAGFLGVCAIFVFLTAWDVFLWALILILDDRLNPIQVGLAKLSWEFFGEAHHLLAMSILSILPVFFVVIIWGAQIGRFIETRRWS